MVEEIDKLFADLRSDLKTYRGIAGGEDEYGVYERIQKGLTTLEGLYRKRGEPAPEPAPAEVVVEPTALVEPAPEASVTVEAAPTEPAPAEAPLQAEPPAEVPAQPEPVPQPAEPTAAPPTEGS